MTDSVMTSSSSLTVVVKCALVCVMVEKSRVVEGGKTVKVLVV